MAHVAIVIGSDAADIDIGPTRLAGDEGLYFVGEGIVELERRCHEIDRGVGAFMA